ncbi:MAG: MerR family transcriptional regulator [Candidatus Dormibacteria bacterium]
MSELTERAGVAPPTVRFYERIGRLSPTRRAPNDYRAFEGTALEELAFVTRAKGIGMTLKDISDLLAAWPSGECQSLQARVRAFLVERIDDVHEQLGELSALERRLTTVRVTMKADATRTATLARLCAAETACCAQTHSVMEIGDGQVTLSIEAKGAPELLDALFGATNPGGR